MPSIVPPIRKIVFLVLLSVACNEVAVNESAERKGKSEPVTTDSEDQEPTAIPPVAVAGAYLYLKCAQELFPSESKIEALIGCRLEGTEGERVPASSLTADYELGWKAENPSDIRAAVRKLSDDTRYDSVVLFKSPSLSELGAALKRVQIIYYQASPDGWETLISGSLPEISVPAASFPEPGAVDYDAIGKELSSLVGGGEPSPPLP